jgi:hypothetical protein
MGMRTAISPTVLGMALGLLGGVAVTRVIATMLFGIEPSDLPTWLVACVAIAVACMAAAYVPARRGADADPMSVLKTG